MARAPRPAAWLPADYSVADIDAMKALAAGTADAAMQLRAVKWIVETAAGTYDLSFRSDGEGGDRETAFAEGKRHVGMQIVKLINLPPKLVAELRKKDA